MHKMLDKLIKHPLYILFEIYPPSYLTILKSRKPLVQRKHTENNENLKYAFI